MIKKIKAYDRAIGDSDIYKTLDYLANVSLTLAVSALMILVIAHVIIGIN